MLSRGDHAPWFEAPLVGGSPDFAFDLAAGRHVILLFHGSAGNERARDALRIAAGQSKLFDDEAASFFAITTDPQDQAAGRLDSGLHHFLDHDGAISRAYGAIAPDGSYRPHWLLLDPALQVVARFDVDRGEQALGRLRSCAEAGAAAGWAPVLAVPNIFEPELCRHLIGLFEADGGQDSGYMGEVEGEAVRLSNAYNKLRRDHHVVDDQTRRAIAGRVARRIAPAVEKAFQYKATHLERYLVACYEVGRGHFRPHRDNTTAATAHRRFAVTINLNTGEYEGGDLRFPEYGRQTYRPPTGGAIVFSGTLLHEATPVTSGRRFCFLSFLYGDEAAAARSASNAKQS